VDRYYDPSTDQFLSVDPLLALTGQPYAFTADDPLNETDPLGLDGCDCPWGGGDPGDMGAATADGAVSSEGDGSAVAEPKPADEATIGSIRESLQKLPLGNSKNTRVVSSEEEVETLYSSFTKGGKALPRPAGFRAVRLSDGTEVQLRDTSKTGGKTIEVVTRNSKGKATGILKVHVK
jgi:uncharacterized protein RhaS with RHS repeats